MDDTTALPGAQNDLEVVKKMEDEHLRLQRQVRMIQADRSHRAMGVHPQFRRQDQLLKTLKKEYIDMMKDLKIARSGAHKKHDKKLKEDLEKELLLMENTSTECEGGLSIMNELDGLVQINSKQMLHLRKRVNASWGELEARRWQSENRLMSAENKLEAAMLRFNSVQCENKLIREQIEHMLKDRAIFNQEWDRMLTALGKGKKFLTDLFESSTLAYDQRDEWCAKLRSIQEKGKMDQMFQVQEMRDIKKAFDHDTKIHNFLAAKGVVRVNKKQEKREEERKRKTEEEHKKQIDAHIKILDEINDYTKEPSYNNIIEQFVKKEQENFSMYCLLTDYCAENEALSRDVSRIRRDVDDRRDWNEMAVSRAEEHLDTLRKQLAEQRSKTDVLKTLYEEKEQLLNGTMEKIQEIFRMLGCSLEPFRALLGDKGPTLHRLGLALRLIADKTREHVQTERVLKRLEKTSTSRLKKFTVHLELPDISTPNPINFLVPADPCPSCIETRWMSRVSEAPETPFDKQQALNALSTLAADPAYVRSDRVHALADCRATASRKLLATRHTQY